MGALSSPEFDPGSYRDPDSRVFRHDSVIYRCLSARALSDFKHVTASDFYQQALKNQLIVATEQLTDVSGLPPLDARWVAVLKHETVPVVSYPYEWPFSMLKDAALLQLDLTVSALEHGLTLKDATPYNVQWFGTSPRFIDIGSFAKYEPGSPWAGYRQFCQQFFYPLLLQAHKGVPYQPWLRGSLEGIEAEQCLSMLSVRDYLRGGVVPHVYLQAKAQSRYEDTRRDVSGDLKAAGFGVALILNNVRRLRRLVQRLEWNPPRSTWSEYTSEHSYEEDDLARKKSFVERVLASRRWPLVWDMGSNTGTYSRVAAEHADYVLALDADHLAVDRMYTALKQEQRACVLPLIADVADPSPGLGWRGRERLALGDRATPDLILCLALIHHLVIGRNIPLDDLVEWLAAFGADLVIEYVGHKDPMVERLLRNRVGQEIEYSADALERALARHFETVTDEALASGTRTLYHAREPR